MDVGNLHVYRPSYQVASRYVQACIDGAKVVSGAKPMIATELKRPDRRRHQRARLRGWWHPHQPPTECGRMTYGGKERSYDSSMAV